MNIEELVKTSVSKQNQSKFHLVKQDTPSPTRDTLELACKLSIILSEPVLLKNILDIIEPHDIHILHIDTSIDIQSHIQEYKTTPEYTIIRSLYPTLVKLAISISCKTTFKMLTSYDIFKTIPKDVIKDTLRYFNNY